MNRYIKLFSLAGCALGFVAFHACTNLEEEVYDQIPQGEFGKNQEQLDALVGPLFGSLADYFGHYAALNTATDEQVIPTRGGDWKDGDQWKRVQQHDWNAQLDDNLFNGLWTFCYNNITSINQQLDNELITSELTKAQLRALRAFYHYVAMDNFGNVIIADGQSSDTPEQSSRAEVYNFIEQELLTVLPNLPTDVVASYGRTNKYVAHMILAKLYLNAEVYTGTAQWEKAKAQCDSIINSNAYGLSGDFFSNFAVRNQDSPEIILAAPMDASARGGMNIQMRTLHYQSQLTYNLPQAPWNGYCTLAEFYNSFEEGDTRKQMWLVGQQYTATGDSIYDEGVPLAFTVTIPDFTMSAGPTARIAGARSVKYQIQANPPGTDQSNDFVIFRLADVYMMRGEAKFRLGDMAGAMEDINYVRERRGVEGFSTLTADDILAERGREFAWEYHRRQDLIRFGRFTDAWEFKPASTEARELYPIPQSQINLNPKLKQNPGY
ncbi:Starch-binding associating with outer membrane [Catalinimonas alkaloidigena]|uniref:Starch-binding associating with outer membrane n=1 Tax=Catalinimonas alkaloidigena TaxID=1075417 RepID=A0A1G9C0A9_9BACT|nr:RagB/SusD family nutrient uptake outer membrane protein [Catalinimonas alkaloidigena]SDK45159.1 Starch-binding associating with outer membrane [Catalinimonas alkaloidigena]